MSKLSILTLLLILTAPTSSARPQTTTMPPAAPAPAPPLTKAYWLFAGFKGNSEDGVYYALSTDGFN